MIVPNPDLSAEYAYNAEAGIEKVIADRVRMRAVGVVCHGGIPI